MSTDPRKKPGNEEDDLNPYGVIKESEEELRLIEKNKPKFGEVQDKFKKSARGPASGLLVIPVNLLIAVGSLTGIGGVAFIIAGLWNWVFTDAPPSDEQIAGFLEWIFYGIVLLAWGALVCLGASKMQSLESYAWALLGALMGVPLIAGIFALVALRDPRVIAGFEEVEGALDEDEPEEEGDDEEEDEDEEEEDEDERPRKRRK